MNWGGRLQAHSQWDNNSESGFDSQMKVLKTATRRIKPRRTQHLILTLYWSSFLSPPGNMIFLRHPQSSWNTGQPCDCSVNLSRRATPLFPIPQLFNRRQILFKAEMIHHAAEFNHRYKMRAVAEEASCYAVLSVWSTYMQLIGPLSPFSPSFTSFLALSNHFIRFLLLCSSSHCWFMSAQCHVSSRHHIQRLLWDSTELHEYPPSDLFYTKALISLHVCLESISGYCDDLIIFPKNMSDFFMFAFKPRRFH